ncbi:MAG: hypothetical protein DDT18_00718 [Actinobacteria bacterium]|nr:hypothetical protein [Actinomycetota bacterium]
MDIPTILNRIAPEAEWMMKGDSYDDLVWLSEKHPKPSKIELAAVWATLSVKVEAERVRNQREQAYREESDPIRHDMDEAYARGNKATGDRLKAQWLAKKDEIRARIR